MTYRPQGPGWRSGKQRSVSHAHDITMVYAITEGVEGGDDYKVVDILGTASACDLAAWRAEFAIRYGFPSDEELECTGLEHYDNLLLRAIETMRAEGYADSTLANYYTYPRLASLFAAWLVRTKGLISLHWHEHNVPSTGVMTEETAREVEAHRAWLVAHDVDPMTPPYVPDDEELADALEPSFDVDEEYAYHWGVIQARECGIPLLGERS